MFLLFNMVKRTLRSKIWKARTFETSWDFANYIREGFHVHGNCSQTLCLFFLKFEQLEIIPLQLVNLEQMLFRYSPDKIGKNKRESGEIFQKV